MDSMPGDTCAVCGYTRAKDKNVSMHPFLRDEARKQRCIEALPTTQEPPI